MAKGIRNPFYTPEPKKDLPSIYDEQPYDTESEMRPLKTAIRLDGDTHVIEFEGKTYDDLRQSLLLFMHDLCKEHKAYLLREGVRVLPPDIAPNTEEGELTLRTPFGSLTVYVGEDNSEIGVFRRLGHVLAGLPDNKILTKHNVRLILRG